jgi:hypothetical protein
MSPEQLPLPARTSDDPEVRPPEPAVGPGSSTLGLAGTHPLALVLRFLAVRTPRLLLITGPPGAGKSTLLALLRRELDGPRLLLEYKIAEEPGSSSSRPADRIRVSFLFTDQSGTLRGDDPVTRPPAPTEMPSFVAVEPDDDAGPFPIMDAIGRMGDQGGGYMFVDTWDRLRRPRPPADRAVLDPTEFEVSSSALRRLTGKLPLATVAVLFGEAEPQIESLADGLVKLGWEEQDGCRVRVLSISKLRGSAISEARALFTLYRGQFDSFPRLPRDFTVPIGPPDPDPAPGSGTQWPGSASFAQAFGRLADNALTGFELPPSHIPRLIAVIGLPAAAHTLRTGGRVI